MLSSFYNNVTSELTKKYTARNNNRTPDARLTRISIRGDINLLIQKRKKATAPRYDDKPNPPIIRKESATPGVNTAINPRSSIIRFPNSHHRTIIGFVIESEKPATKDSRFFLR